MSQATAKIPANRRYRVAGEVRGIISYHRELSAAARSMHRDAAGCDSLGGGAYSDASVMEQVRPGVWEHVEIESSDD